MQKPVMNTVRPKHRSSWFSPAQCLAYYKKSYAYREIQIHWWDDPKNKPSHNGVVSYTANKTGGSVNYVASGGKITKMVDESNCALTTQGGNPNGIKIECSPYGTAKDYESIGWLVADIWRRKGKKPLVPHKKYWNTACPGTLSLKRIETEANKWLTLWKQGEQEMVTLLQQQVLYRFYLGREVSATGKKNVGKKTFAAERKRLMESAAYKAIVKKAAQPTFNEEVHLPSAIRAAYKG